MIYESTLVLHSTAPAEIVKPFHLARVISDKFW